MFDRALPLEDLMKAEDAAKKLGICVKTLMGHVDAGRLCYINIGNAKRRQLRFTGQDVTSFIESQEVVEVPRYQSFPAKNVFTKSTLSFGATLFSAVPKPGNGKKPKP